VRHDQTVRPESAFLLSTLFVGLSASGDSIVGFDSKSIGDDGGSVAGTNGDQHFAGVLPGNPNAGVPVTELSHYQFDAGAGGTSDLIAFNSDNQSNLFGSSAGGKAAAQLPGAPASDDHAVAAETSVPLATPFLSSAASGDSIVGFEFKESATGGGYVTVDLGNKLSPGALYGNTASEIPISDQNQYHLTAGSGSAPDAIALTFTDFSGSGSGTVTTGASGGNTFETVGSGGGIIFNDTFTANCSQAYIACVVAAENAIRSLWTNSVTLNVTFDAQASGTSAGFLAENSYYYVNVSYASLKSALAAHAFGADAQSAVSTLPATDPNPAGGDDWSIPVSYARMLGLTNASAPFDDMVTINTSYNWSYGQDVTNTVEHELSEGGMGRVGGLGDQNSSWSTMDLFRFNATGARDYTDGRDGAATYFSDNGGATLSSSAGLSFNNEFNAAGNQVNSGDTADFRQLDVFGTGSPGETNSYSQTDKQIMDVLGWDPATAAPTLTITSTGSLTNQTTQTISGTIDAADAGLTVSIYDGATLVGTVTPAANGTWSKQVTLLATQGAQTITAQATNAAGGVGTSNSVTYTLDTVAPTLAVTSTGGLTNHTAQTISGTIDSADAGLTVSIYDGATLLGTVIPAANGTWSKVVTLPSTQGAQAITAQATDAAGNVGTSSPVTYTLDTVAPMLTIANANTLTNRTAQTISGTIDSADAGLTVSIYDGATLVGTVTPAANGTWSKAVTLLAAQGAQAITAQATDAAGNVGTSSPVTYTLDTVAPTLTITSAGVLTNQTAQTISGTIDSADAGLTVSIYDGATLVGTVTPAANGTWSKAVTLLATQGAQAITAQATDAAGNVGTSTSVTYTLDTVAPALAITSAGNLTNHTAQTISGTIDSADAGLTVSIYDGATLLGTVIPAANGSWSKAVTLLSTQGAQAITAQATDAAGNLGASSPVTYTLDTVAPTLVVTSTGGLTNHTAQTISGTIDSADAGLTVSIYDGATLVGTVTPAANGSWSKAVTLLSTQGAQAITAQATDAAGNVGASGPISYTLDTVAPTLTIANTNTLTNQTTQTISGTIDSADAGLTVSIYDGATLVGTVTPAVNGTWSKAVALLATQGAQAITAQATDAAGNLGTSSPVTYTLDTVAPTLAVTSTGVLTNQTTQTISGTIDSADAGLTVSIYDGATLLGTVIPAANGSWSKAVTLLSTQGAQSITAQATDAAGNVGTSSPVSYTLDTVAPTLAITSTGVLTNQTAQTISGTIDSPDAGLTVSIYDGATLVGTVTPAANGTWSKAVTLLATQGAQAITAQATDAAGNVGTSSPVSYALDTVAPALAITSAGSLTNQMAQTISGTIDSADAGLTVSIYDGATLVGTVTPAANGSWSKAVTLLSTQGAQAITAQATDAVGNLGTSSAITYTLDTTPASQVHEGSVSVTAETTVTIPESQLQFDDNASAHAQETYTVIAAPSNGELLKNGSATLSFTQADIDSGLISYQETNPSASSDFFTFKVTDAAENQTAIQQFQFQIFPIPLPAVTPHSMTVANAQSVPITDIFSVSGSDITEYQIWFSDPEQGAPALGTVTDNGAAIALDRPVMVTSLSGLEYTGSATAGTDEIWLQAYNGSTWTGWAQANITDPGTSALVASAVTPHSMTVANAQSVPITDIFSVSGSDITEYQIWFSYPEQGAPALGTVTDNGATIALDRPVTITSLSGLEYTGSATAGTDEIWLQAYNGSIWTGWAQANITDPGASLIEAGATVELNGPNSSSITFDGPTGALVLDHSSEFSGQIFNFTGDGTLSTSDQIDLRDIGYGTGTTASYTGNVSGGTLTVSDAQHDSASISLSGDYINSTFSTSSDGNGGTSVVDPAVTQSLSGGTFVFNEADSAGKYTVSVAAQDSGLGYVGSFTVDAGTMTNGQETVGWHFNVDPHSIAQTTTQSYNVSVADIEPNGANNITTQSLAVTIGGPGNDSFVFRPGLGADIIVNATSSDIIELDGFSSVTSITQLQTHLTEAQTGQSQSLFEMANGGHDTVLNLGNHDSITLVNVEVASLHASNFVVHPPLIG
jgi:hypothetical protein